MKQKFSAAVSATGRYLNQNPSEPALLLCSLVYILLALSTKLYRRIDPSGDDKYIAAALSELIVIALPALIYYILRSYSRPDGSRAPNIGAYLMSRDKIFITLIASFALISESIAINAIGARLGIQASSEGLLEIDGGEETAVWLRIISLALVPALAEEFLCRGIIMGESRLLGSWRSVILGSLSFAMLHFTLERFLLYLFCGFILSVLFVVTDSIVATVTAHFIFNLFTLLAGGLLTALGEQIGDLLILFFLSALIFLICSMLAFKELARIYGIRAKHPESQLPYSPGSQRTPPVSLFGLFTPTLALCIILYIIFSIFN